MKMLLNLIICSLILAAGLSAQSHEPFTGGSPADVSGTQQWIKMGGQTHTSASIGKDGGGRGKPWVTADSAGVYAHALWDSATGTDGELSLILVSFVGASASKELVIYRDDNTTFASGGGVTLQIIPRTSSTMDLYLRYYNQYSCNGYPYCAVGDAIGSQSLTGKAWAAGDTVFLRYWGATGMWVGGIRHVGGGADTMAFLTSLYTGSTLTTMTNALASTGRFGLGGAVRTTPNLFDDVRIVNPSSAAEPPPPPADVDTVSPTISVFSPSMASHYAGTTPQPYLSIQTSDNFGVNRVAFDSSSNGGSTWVPFDSSYANVGSPVLTFSEHSTAFSRTGADTVHFRARVTDDTGNVATSSTVQVIFYDSLAGGDKVTRLFADLSVASVNFPGQSGGEVDLSKLSFSAFDVVSLWPFYPVGPDLYMTDNADPMDGRFKYVVDYIHAQGRAATVCIGVNNVSRWNQWIFPRRTAAIAHFMSFFIDQMGADGLEIDIEPYSSADTLNMRLFIDEMRDSLNTRTSAYTWTGKPIITFDGGSGKYNGNEDSKYTGNDPPTSSLWRFLARIAPKVDMLNMMTYDKMGSWTGFTGHENAVFAYPSASNAWNDGWWNSCDWGSSYNGCPNMAGSMETTVKILLDVGVDPQKIGVGFDAFPSAIRGGLRTDGEGALRPRQVSTSAANFGTPFYGGAYSSAAEWKYWHFFNTYLTVYPDSIHWDDSSGTYYMSRNFAGTASDEYVSFQGHPTYRNSSGIIVAARDSGVNKTLRLTERYGLGGVLVWNIAEGQPRQLDAPPDLDYNWLNTAFNKYKKPGVIIIKKRPPVVYGNASGGDTSFTNIIPGTGVIRFENVSGATKFWVQISRNAAFTNLVFDDSTITPPDTIVSTSTCAIDSSYYVRAATKDTVWGNFSGAILFTTAAANIGTLVFISPTNGETGVSTSPTIQFAVPMRNIGPARVPTPSMVHLRIATDTNFAAVAWQDTVEPNEQYVYADVTGLAGSTKYYLSGRMLAPTGTWTSWSSATYNFTTVLPVLYPPTLYSPVNLSGGHDTNSINFRWFPVTGASRYRLRISTHQNFTNTMVDAWVFDTDSTIGGFSSADTLFWKVQSGRSASDTSVFSGPLAFVTSIGGIVPEGGEEVQFSWWDPLRRAWIFNEVPPYFALADGPLASLPRPSREGVVYMNRRGYKTSTGDTVAFGEGSLSDADILSVLANNAVTMTNPTLLGGVTLRNDLDTTISGRITPPAAGSNVNVQMPRAPGTLGTTTEQSASFTNLSATNLSGATSTITTIKPSFITSPASAHTMGLRFTNYSTLYPNSDGVVDLGSPMTRWNNVFATIMRPDSLVVNGTPYTGGGTDLGNATPDTVRASIYMDDSAKVNTSSQVGTYRGYYGWNPDVQENGVWSTGSNGAAWLGTINDESGVRVTDQSGAVVVQNTAAERTQRLKKGSSNSDPFFDTWQFKKTTTDATPAIAGYVRFDTANGGNEDYYGYSNRPGSYIVYIDVVGARTDVDGYLMYSRRCLVDNIAAGGVSLRTTDSIGTDQAGGTGGISIATSGSFLNTTVTGVGSQTWQWAITYRVIGIGN